jgi:hypothetical protein
MSELVELERDDRPRLLTDAQDTLSLLRNNLEADELAADFE